MKKALIISLILLPVTLKAQSVFRGNFFVRSIYSDTSFCTNQYIEFGFKKDSAVFKIDGEFHVFHDSHKVWYNVSGKDTEVFYKARKEKTPYTLRFILYDNHLTIFITNSKRGYPTFVVSSVDMCGNGSIAVFEDK